MTLAIVFTMAMALEGAGGPQLLPPGIASYALEGSCK
jgi:hypothetical protein